MEKDLTKTDMTVISDVLLQPENKPITQPELHTMIAQKHALKLEIKGLKSSKGNIYLTIKKNYGLEGTKEQVLINFASLIENKKVEYWEANEKRS